MKPLTAVSDAARTLPENPARRQDEAAAALASLLEERRRLLRIGLEEPIARCEDQIRYWRFVAGLVGLPRVSTV